MNNNTIEKIKEGIEKAFPFDEDHTRAYIEILEYQEDFKKDMEDELHETADGMTEIYNSELLMWLKESRIAIDIMEEVIKEGLVDTKNYNFFRHVMAANYQYHWNMFNEIHQKAVTIFESIEEEES